ncbi:hybrid sensor histidine kinase/response regulator [Saccharospirillum mangrovi]|uniref:hybrid sensor histidine kinase/response regulator n=1 Tax=Saccharospirillum mangrovi TaxID=2161747 RepID=UPI000D3920AD|nr:hybrid sensor histidine kinase/response regulator [Saccharospirillum mangrovi]
MTLKRVALFFCGLFWLAHTNAGDLNALMLEADQPVQLSNQVMILEDPEGDLSPFEVLSDSYMSQWRAAQGSELKRNYRNGVTWVLFRLDASRSIHKEWDLVIANPSIKTIDLYQRFDLSGPRLVHRTGSLRPFESRAKDHRFFVLPLEVYGPTTFLMRVGATSNSSLPMTLYPSQAFWSSVQLSDFGNWLFYGVILSMVTYNLFLFFTVRDSSYLWYVLFIGCFGTIQFSLDGYLFQYFWWDGQGFDGRVNYWLAGMIFCFAGCFILKFLDLPRVSKPLSAIVMVAIFLQLAVAALSWYLDRALMGRLLTFNGIFFLSLAMLVGVYAWFKGLVAAKYFVIAWLVFYLCNMVYLLNGMGLFQLPFPAILISKLGAFMETMLLSFALAHRIRVLRESGERERMRAEAQSYFLAQISHEIRTPLNGVLGMTEVLARTPLDEEQRAYVDTIQGSGASLMALINDILDYSKIEAGKMALHVENVEIRDLIEQQIQLFQAHAEQKGLSLSAQLGDEMASIIQVDGQRLRQVLSNLISNAIKFTEAGQVLLVVNQEEREGESWLVCRVIDSGIGIAPSELSSLFNVYSQLPAAQQKERYGTGLGLAISRQLVQLMGGKLEVSSQLGQGSEFRLSVPLQTGAVELSAEEVDSEYSPMALTVLVAEDNVVNQRVIKGLLEKLGHHPILATNGDQAVLARQDMSCSADLILMDCEMPEMDGYRATQLIRAYERQHQQPRLPIIALTAHALEEVRQRCLDAGMDDFLTKPVSTRQLEKTLRRFNNAD